MSSQEIELLTEIRDLLRVMAEPALAERDRTLREALRTAVGASKKKAQAALLMDGSRVRQAIVKEAGIDQGTLSRFVKNLIEVGLVAPNEQQIRMLIDIPPNFFEQDANK